VIDTVTTFDGKGYKMSWGEYLGVRTGEKLNDALGGGCFAKGDVQMLKHWAVFR